MIVCDTGPLVAAADRDDHDNRACTDLLTGLHTQTVTIVDLELADYDRMADLVETYADFPLGTTDAAVIAVAERLRITEIASLDHRHFHVVRPRHTDSFTLLP